MTAYEDHVKKSGRRLDTYIAEREAEGLENDRLYKMTLDQSKVLVWERMPWGTVARECVLINVPDGGVVHTGYGSGSIGKIYILEDHKDKISIRGHAVVLYVSEAQQCALLSQPPVHR